MLPDIRDFCGAFRGREEADTRAQYEGIAKRSPQVLPVDIELPEGPTSLFIAKRYMPGDLFDYRGIFLNRQDARRACGEEDYTEEVSL